MTLSAFRLPIAIVVLALLYFGMQAELNDARKLGSQNAFYTGELAEVARLEREMLTFLNLANTYVAGRQTVRKEEVLLAFDVFWSRVNTTHSKRFITRIDELRKYEPFIEELAQKLRQVDSSVQGLQRGDLKGIERIDANLQPFVPEASHFTATAFAELQKYSLHQAYLQRSAMNGLYKVQLGFLLVTSIVVLFLLYQLERRKLLLNQLQRREKEISLLAITDHLTGLYNRRKFDSCLEDASRDAAPRQHNLLIIDLDGFKAVNDSYGHATGDEILRSVAATLQRLSGPEDVLARLGGDEFAILTQSGHENAARLASAIVEAMRAPFQIDSKSIAVGACVGIASCDNQQAVTKMLHDADLALYRAKQHGRSQFVYYSEDFAKLAAANTTSKAPDFRTQKLSAV